MTWAHRLGRWLGCGLLIGTLQFVAIGAAHAADADAGPAGNGAPLTQALAEGAHTVASFAQPSAPATPAAHRAPARTHTPASAAPSAETAQALRIVLGLTMLAVLPALLVCVTSFLRIIIVLSMLRQAIGMPQTPPNTVLIGLALFLTMFTMSPVLQKVNEQAFQPFMAGTLSVQAAYEKGSAPMREFMVRQTREEDLALMVELSKAKPPQSMDDISNVQLIPAYMLSELRAAFQIGFVVFLPFLLIDLIVSSVLMALGMMMMPPATIALPLKILMFVLIDGWSLLLKALVGSFH
ncbi:flagellar type III secretion system pore protein FliP [Trinickia fusca]|uniref:flagellar type III secretion system pore protein FliP n=1 Tax=Trinickia fusca TaxID=2419777 RepID=UPI001FE7DD2F|nr:flagellar type III secretion system pore protein FliP [Trinickia fusca]